MANFTALKTAINNAIRTNGNEEITGAILQAILDAMVETLGDSAINDLENAITTEVTNRENAVGGMADDLAAEVQARQALDYNVNNRINAEEYNRQNADAALSQTMSQGFQTLGSQMTALNAAISALNAAYQNGYLYGGIATPSSSPSNNKCFYIALQGGTYTNFGGVGVIEGINIIKNDSGWKVEHIYDQTTLLNEFYLLRQQVIRAISSIDPIVIQGDVTNAPDEEDLTSDAQHLLKFKDRAYSPLNFSGLGMKILRKNIAPLSDSAAFNGFVEGVTAEETLAGTPELIFWDRMNTRFIGIKDGIYYAAWTDDDNYVPVSTSLVYMYNGTPYQWTGSDFIVDETEVPNLVNSLTQDMINEANTIYIIRYDYTLKEDITIPANCVLEFDGGSISGEHAITGVNTSIQAGLVKIFGADVLIAGSWNIPKIYSEWFINVTNENKLKNVFNLCNANIQNTVFIAQGVYDVSVSGDEENEVVINIPSNTTIINNGTIKLAGTSVDGYRIFQISQAKNISLLGGVIQGDKYTHTTETGEWGHGIYISDSSNINIVGVEIKECWGDGVCIAVKTTERVNIDNCYIHDCRRQGISLTGGTLINISNTKITDISGTAPFACIDIEPNNTQYVKNVVIDNCTFDSDRGILMTGADDERQIENIIVSNCSITSNNSYALQINHGKSVSIRNNVITHNGHLVTYGISVSQSYNVIIEHNRLYAKNTTSESIYLLSLTNKDYDRIIVKNNLIDTDGKLVFFRGSIGLYDNDITASDIFTGQNNNNLQDSEFRGNTINGVTDAFTSYIKWLDNIFNGAVNTAAETIFNGCTFNAAVETQGDKTKFTNCIFNNAFRNARNQTNISHSVFNNEVSFVITSGSGIKITVADCIFNNTVNITTSSSVFSNNVFNDVLDIKKSENDFIGNRFNNTITGFTSYYNNYFENIFDVNNGKVPEDSDYTANLSFVTGNKLKNNTIFNAGVIIDGVVFEGNTIECSIPATSSSTKKIIDCINGCVVTNNNFHYTGTDTSINYMMLDRQKNIITQNRFISDTVTIENCVGVRNTHDGGAIFANNIIVNNITALTNDASKFLDISNNIILA